MFRKILDTSRTRKSFYLNLLKYFRYCQDEVKQVLNSISFGFQTDILIEYCLKNPKEEIRVNFLHVRNSNIRWRKL